ncbi:MAG TPA: inositol monophosphatase family protein [Verrucomicrobiae bacterium]|jgi:fructose-1,6-bisphosphatase/inositol monophosphatase family enzyme|nr:inositol monophosphatase family protein [Verrucomicrobiae bacterium]
MNIFLSYPDTDRPFARQIKLFLREWGHEVFLAADEANNQIRGDGWLDALIDRIEGSDIFILCLRESSLKAGIQKLEWTNVVVRNTPEKRIIIYDGDWNPLYESKFKCVRNFQCFRRDDLKDMESLELALSEEPPEEERFTFLERTVIEAGTQLLLRQSGEFFGPHRVLDERKNCALSLDVEIQNQIISQIRARFPGDGIIAEEETERGISSDSTTGFVWTVDPLDGTLNFMRGDDKYCCGVGVLRDGLPFMGAIFVPSRMELFTGGVGRKAKCHSISSGAVKIINTDSEVKHLAECHALSHINSETPRLDLCFENDLPKRLHISVRRVWMWGCGLMAGVSVAQGCHHLFFQRVTYPYDLVPYLPIIESAGGVWRTIPKKPSLCWNASKENVGIIVACNEAIMKEFAAKFPELEL